MFDTRQLELNYTKYKLIALDVGMPAKIADTPFASGRRLFHPTYVTAAGHENPLAYPGRWVDIRGAHLHNILAKKKQVQHGRAS